MHIYTTIHVTYTNNLIISIVQRAKLIYLSDFTILIHHRRITLPLVFKF